MSSSGEDWSAVGEGKKATITASLTLVVLSLRQIVPFPHHLHQNFFFFFQESFVRLSLLMLSFSIIQLLTHHPSSSYLFNNRLVT